MSESERQTPHGSYLSKRGYVIRKDTISDKELKFLKTTLVARPLQDDKYTFFNKQDNSFPIYIETKNKIYIPKMFGINRYGFPEGLMPNYTGIKWDKDITFNGNLYPIQQEAVLKLVNELKNGKTGGILSLSTGSGKTISALNVLSNIRGKTLIIVNKIPLMKQWESEIKNFLPDAEIGFIQGQKNVSVKDKDIVIAMLQSLAKIDYPDSLFETINTVIVDECHNLSSRVFSQVLSKLSCQYTVGLSATPKRSDGCEYVFKYHIGDIVYQSDKKRSGLDPIIRTIKIDSEDYKEISTINQITGQNQIQFTSMISQLITIDKRNKLIIELIKHLVINENRKILILSDRRDHVKTLKTNLDNDVEITFTYGLFLGQMKYQELERSKSSQVILATFSAFGEGVSEKDLDTLILITPKKFIGHLKNSTKNESGKLEQIVGRIFRKEHTEKNPLIIDLQDNFSVYKTQNSGRNVFYKQHFQNAVFENHNINLDNYDLDNISVNCIEKRTKRLVKKQDEENTKEMSENLKKFCIIED
jgi:superfamily II DNA or RNA helicase